MNAIQTDKFYKDNKYEYEIKNNMDYVIWFINTFKDGNNSYCDLNSQQRLIDTIVNWYEFKFPNRKLLEEFGVIDPQFKDFDSIGNKMDIDQLLYTLDNNALSLLKCDYRTGSGADNLTFVDIEVLKENPLINTDFNYIQINSQTGLVDDHRFPYNITIEGLYDLLLTTYNDSFNLDAIKKCIDTHAYDLELRNRILNLVSLKLLYSSNTDPSLGYIRAKKFIEEFNSKFNLNISSEQIDEIYNKYSSLNESDDVTRIRKSNN